jgi:hypothetical protein
MVVVPMTPEQKLQILQDALTNIASIGDGDVQALLKANQMAADAINSINLKRWAVVVETTLEAERVAEWLESVSDFKCLSVTRTETMT